jgi:hypothetical protein
VRIFLAVLAFLVFSPTFAEEGTYLAWDRSAQADYYEIALHPGETVIADTRQWNVPAFCIEDPFVDCPILLPGQACPSGCWVIERHRTFHPFVFDNRWSNATTDYKVRACNVVGCSPWTTPVTATTGPFWCIDNGATVPCWDGVEP